MITAKSADEVRTKVLEARRAGRDIGLVPTMGALHEGHASLVRMSVESCGFTVASIFVNPVQFGPEEDLGKYPRTLEKDLALLERLGCDLVFTPGAEDMYDGEGRTAVSVEGLTGRLCGASRPGHFQGVLLVVAKLLNIVSPDTAFFGQKDAQQAVVIQRMAADLDFQVRIRLGATVREADGLAMSSRNAYLGEDERARAAGMYRGLRAAADMAVSGERSAARLESAVRDGMDASGFEVDYVEVVSGGTLEPLETIDGTVLIAAAGRIGGTRLIDNIALRIDGGSAEETLLEFPEWSRYEWE